MAEIVIRPYHPADLPELRRITIESFGGVSLEQMLEERFGQWAGQDWMVRKAASIDDDCAANPGGVFVAGRGAQVLGYITTRVDAPNLRGRIPNMAVIEAARGLGLGRRLIEHALEYFRSRGLKLAMIETMASNAVGQHLYPACGFEEIARQVHYGMRL